MDVDTSIYINVEYVLWCSLCVCLLCSQMDKQEWDAMYQKCQKFAKLEYETTKEHRRRRNQSNAARIRIQVADGKMGELLACHFLRGLGLEVTEPDFEIYEKAKKSFDADFYVNGHPMHCKSQNAESAARYGLSWMFQKGGMGYGHTDPCLKTPTDKAVFVKVDHRKRTGEVFGPFSMGDLIPKFRDPKLARLKGIKTCIYAEDLADVVKDSCTSVS